MFFVSVKIWILIIIHICRTFFFWVFLSRFLICINPCSKNIVKRPQCYRANLLSQGGRLALIKSVQPCLQLDITTQQVLIFAQQFLISNEILLIKKENFQVYQRCTLEAVHQSLKLQCSNISNKLEIFAQQLEHLSSYCSPGVSRPLQFLT